MSKDRLRIPDLDVQALRRQFRFLGHAARQATREPHALLSRALMWNRHAEGLTNVNRRSKFQRLGHVGKFCPWSNFEQPFTNFFFKQYDLDWTEVAQNRTQWKRWESQYISFRLGEFGNSACLG